MALGTFHSHTLVPAAQSTCESSLESKHQIRKGHHYHRNSQVTVIPPTELEGTHTHSEGIDRTEEP